MPLPPPGRASAIDLSGRVIMVTGAAGGLGKPLALACAAHGATVVLHGRVVRKLEALYDEIVSAGHPQPTILPLDLATASADDFGNVAAALRAQLGRLDGLVHAAAFARLARPDRAPVVRRVAKGAARQRGRGDGADAIDAAAAFRRAGRAA